MEVRPRIAVPIPTSTDQDYNRRCWPDYARAVYLSGGQAIEIPLGLPLQQLAALSRSCLGVVLTGSPADVDPGRYGQGRTEECALPDPQREETDLFLIEEAASREIPLLAVCFGTQILNVSRGGTLIQDLTVLPVHHAAGPGVAIAHSVSIAPESLIGSILMPSVAESEPFSLMVNSSHHQAVAIPGAGLRVAARCPQDAVVEALEGTSEKFLVGVQWHPERNFSESPASQALFARFIAATRDSSYRGV